MSSVVPKERFVQDFFIETTKSNDPFNSPFTLEGEVFIATAGVPTDVWVPGGFQGELATAEFINVSSTSTDDANGGIGSNLTIVAGLDENFVPIQEVVVMNGTTPVQTLQKFLRANNIAGFISGSNQANVGVISAISDDTTRLLSQIAIGKAVSHNSQNTVPRGRVFVLKSIEISVVFDTPNPNNSVTIQYVVKPFGTNTWFVAIETVCSEITKIEQGVTTLELEKDEFRIVAVSNVNGAQVFTRSYHINTSIQDTQLGIIPPGTSNTLNRVY